MTGNDEDPKVPEQKDEANEELTTEELTKVAGAMARNDFWGKKPPKPE
jgi:hypothetical protein